MGSNNRLGKLPSYSKSEPEQASTIQAYFKLLVGEVDVGYKVFRVRLFWVLSRSLRLIWELANCFRQLCQLNIFYTLRNSQQAWLAAMFHIMHVGLWLLSSCSQTLVSYFHIWKAVLSNFIISDHCNWIQKNNPDWSTHEAQLLG